MGSTCLTGAAAPPPVYPAVPDVEVRYDFSYNLELPSSTVAHDIDTVTFAFGRCFATPVRIGQSVANAASGSSGSSTHPFSALSRVKGYIAPGTTTLLLSPPGGGKTCFLKALAGRLPVSKLQGEIRYNGASQKELAQRGIQLKLLSNYVDQLDVHLPYLTVRETADFACANSTVVPAMMGDPMLVSEAAGRVDRVLKLLSLTNCANTLVGNELVRGVSGGEKKRVTIAEALVSNARLLCMDEISTGLDASVTFDICASIRAWTMEMRGTVVIALLQPTPEVYSLFDDVLLLRGGCVIYHGGRAELAPYLGGLGFTPPADLSEGGGADSADVADWVTEIINAPESVYKAQLAKASSASRAAVDEAPPAAVMTAQAEGGPKRPPLSTAELAAAWAASDACARRDAAEAKSMAQPMDLESPFALQQYGQKYPRSFPVHFLSLLKRQVLVTGRNSLFVSSRLISACLISAILGSVWWQLDSSKGFQKFGMLLFATLQVAFSNLSETPFAVEFKYVAYKHMAAGMYPPMAYVAAATCVHIPIAAVECAFFSVVLFFMVGLDPGTSDADQPGGRWAFFYFTLFLTDLCMGSIFRSFAYVLPNMEAAQTAPGPFIAMQVIFAGFLITPNHMGCEILPKSFSTCVRRVVR